MPALWRWEVANGLLMAERRKRITSAENHRHLARLKALPIELDASAFDSIPSRSSFRRCANSGLDQSLSPCAEIPLLVPAPSHAVHLVRATTSIDDAAIGAEGEKIAWMLCVHGQFPAPSNSAPPLQQRPPLILKSLNHHA